MNIGVVGAGNISKAHIRELAAMNNALVLGVTDVIPDAARRVAEEFHLANVYKSVDEMVADADVDAVIIGIPNRWHAPLAIQSLQAGKHVLLEKPMAINAQAAKDIVRAHRDSDKTLMMSQQMRWGWPAMIVKEQVNKGALGHIYAAKSGWFRRKGIPGSFIGRFFIKPPPEPDEPWPSCFSFWEPKASWATVPARSDPAPTQHLGSISRRW